MMYESMRLSFAFLQHSLLVLFREPNVKLRTSMSMHELETVDLELCAAEPV
jgi:hypothetical protein